MKKISLRKMNNAGSTFILAIVIISLVTTLALAIMAASMSNISMKNVDRNVKSTFYTAESVLDEIPGIGEARKKELLRRFKSVEGIRDATISELCEVKGITEEIARKIKEVLE